MMSLTVEGPKQAHQSIQTSVKLRYYRPHQLSFFIFLSFQKITFKLGNFTDVKAPFPAGVSTDFR